MTEVEERLFDAVLDGHAEEVLSLLRDNPGLDVNWADYKLWTALHFASWHGHVEVVKLLWHIVALMSI